MYFAPSYSLNYLREKGGAHMQPACFYVQRVYSSFQDAGLCQEGKKLWGLEGLFTHLFRWDDYTFTV